MKSSFLVEIGPYKKNKDEFWSLKSAGTALGRNKQNLVDTVFVKIIHFLLLFSLPNNTFSIYALFIL
jgi:hypothetical protein